MGFLPASWVPSFLNPASWLLQLHGSSFLGLVMDLVILHIFGYHTSFVGRPAFRDNFGPTSFKGIFWLPYQLSGCSSFQAQCGPNPAFWSQLSGKICEFQDSGRNFVSCISRIGYHPCLLMCKEIHLCVNIEFIGKLRIIC